MLLLLKGPVVLLLLLNVDVAATAVIAGCC